MTLKYDCMWFNMDDHGMIMGCLEWLYVGRNCFMVFFHGDVVMKFMGNSWEIHGMPQWNAGEYPAVISNMASSEISYKLVFIGSFYGKIRKMMDFPTMFDDFPKGISGSHRFDPSNLWRTKITKYESTTHLRLQIKRKKTKRF